MDYGQPTSGEAKQDPFAALEECMEVVAVLRAKINSLYKHIEELETAIRNANNIIVKEVKAK